MEEEIDLRVYVEVLLRYWMWIVGLAVGAAVVGLIVSLLLPPAYEASAVVLVTEPRYQMEFDSRFATELTTPAYRAFPTLATSDGILGQVLEAYSPPPQVDPEAWTLAGLSSMVEANSEGDPSLVVLGVTSQLPEVAAGVANAWADVLVKAGNGIYAEGEEDLAFFEEQLEQARQALEGAEAALVEFEARNEGNIVAAQLHSLLQTQADYLAEQRRIIYIVQDIGGLRAQLAEQSAGQSVTLGDSLTTLFLQVKAFNAQASAPIQLQVDSADALSDKTRAEQITFLDNLVVTLEARSAELDARLAELEPRILSLQRDKTEINVESDRLTRSRDLARETYMTLARKVDEARIAAQEENGTFQVGSYAAVPEKPVGPQKKLITAVAGMLGLMVGVVGVFVVDFWRQGRT